MLMLVSLTAVRYVVSSACKSADVGQGDYLAEQAARAVGVLHRYFVDPSGRLTKAISLANERSWQAIEIALAGDSFWERCKATFTSAEDRNLSTQVRDFLDKVPLNELPGNRAEFRRECLDQLRRARRAGTLSRGQLDPRKLEQAGSSLARYADPSALLQAEWQAVGRMADELRPNYPLLAQFVGLQTGTELPLLAVAARYYFRRAVEQDAELARGLSFARLEAIGSAQDAGFARLEGLFTRHADRLEELLNGLLVVAVETRQSVQRVEEQLAAYQRQIEELIQRLGMQHQKVQSKDSLLIKTDEERRLIRETLNRYRTLPEDQRRKCPELLSSVAQLENAAGDHQQALLDFQLVAEIAGNDKPMEAQAHYNAYRAALERAGTAKTREDAQVAYGVALSELLKAFDKDRRFMPFDARKYQPQRILGAGGFGVTFLCKRRGVDDLVAVKSIAQENLGRDMGEVLREGQLLGTLDHPAIIRLIDCDYVDPDARTAPFVVMVYFDGQTLEEHVKRFKYPKPEDAVGLFRVIAQGFRVAHERGVLHRDIKPANLLVRKVTGTLPRIDTGWQVKIIDFGLALRRELTASTLASRRSQSVLGESIAGTANYASPEQLDSERSNEVGPWSDVYGFGKTCYYTLFGTPTPDDEDKDTLPDELKKLLSRCTASTISRRPQSFREVEETLIKIERNLIPSAEAVEAVPVETPPSHQWYYSQGGQSVGPVTETKLKQLLSTGTIKPSDAVWRQGLANWKAAETIPGLVPQQLPPPPPTTKAVEATSGQSTIRFFMEPGVLAVLSVVKKLLPGVLKLKVYINNKYMGEHVPDEGFDYTSRIELGSQSVEVVLWSSLGEVSRKRFPVQIQRPGGCQVRFNYVYTPPNPVIGFFGGDKGHHIDNSTIDII